VYVVCFDRDALSAVSDARIPGVVPVPIEQVELAHPELAAAKAGRSRVEYYFTSTPTVITYALESTPSATWVTYLDADLWFFSSPNELYKEQERGSVSIIEHGYRPKDAWRKKFGIYNVGWVSFRNDEDGRRCLDWWRERCNEWCYDRAEDGRFADQGYLDQFKLVSSRLVVIQHPGANLAPWNLATRTVACDDDVVMVDGAPLVFFHFHGLQSRNDRWYLAHARYGARTTQCIRDGVYRPYLRALDEARVEVGHTADTAPRRRGSIAGAAKHGAARLLAQVRGDVIKIT
jgi:hypothetical protein